MKVHAARATTARELGLLTVTGVVLVCGMALAALGQRVSAQEAVADDAVVQDEVSMMPASEEREASEVGINVFGTATEEVVPSLALLADIAAFVQLVGDDTDSIFLGGMFGTTDVRAYGEELCQKNFIRPSACTDWLIAEFADASCQEAGAFGKGACERLLTERNDGVFPGCAEGDLTDCERSKALLTIGAMRDDVLHLAEAIISRGGEEQVLVTLSGLASITADRVATARWWGSPRAIGQQTSVGMVVVDADMDGLPDDYEAIIGTDPSAADTDGDGVSDIDELRAGTNPLGEGELGRDLTDAERTIVFSRPLQQPSAKLEADAGFMLGRSGAGDGLVGTCEPGAICILYLYSYVPMILTTVADASGAWEYRLTDVMADGHHVAYVAVTDGDGAVLRRSSPFSFFVNEARAVTVEEFLDDSIEPFALARSVEERSFARYLFGTAAVMFVAIILTFAILRERPSAIVKE